MVFIMALGELFIAAEIIIFLMFLLFLDYENGTKESDDILDIMFRWNKFPGFKSYILRLFQKEI